MKLNVSRLRKEAGSFEEFKFTIPPIRDLDGVRVNESIAVEGRVYNTGETLQIRVKAATVLTLQCDRCLEDKTVPLDFQFVENYCHESDYDEEFLENNDIIVYNNDIIDMVQAVTENLVLNLPMRFLCDPECPGICPHCGQNLKEKKCGCVNETVDPRLAVLAKLKGVQE